MMQAIYSAFKKDEDLRLVENSKGEVFVETSVPILLGSEPVDMHHPEPSVSTMIKKAVASSTVLEDNIAEPLPDIRVQNIALMFAGNAGIQFTWFLITGIFYYWNTVWPRDLGLILLLTSIGMFCLWYGLMLWVRKEFPIFAVIAVGFWTLTGGTMLGSIAVLTHNLAPLQLVLLLLFQSFVVMAYAKLSPRLIETVKAMAFMFIVTLIVWASFIFIFVEEQDWSGGITILLVSFSAILYHGWEIRMSEGRYSLSWEDVRISIIQFYGDPILYAYAEIIRPLDK